MAMYGETVRHGADHPGTPIKILQSAAGYYVGYLDGDGMPYSRESEYYLTRQEVVDAIDNGTVAWR